MNRQFFKDNAPLIAGMAVTAAGVTVAGIVFHQSFFRILPLYVSLVIGLLQSRMIRYASLIGGVNSILYALVDLHYHLYASAAYALLVSCPIQIVTFIRWSRKPWGQSTVFRSLTAKQRIVTGAVYAGLLVGLGFLLPRLGGEHSFLDSAVTLLGILTSFLTMLSYKEYALLLVAGAVLSPVLYIAMLPEHPEQATYLIFSLYSLVCGAWRTLLDQSASDEDYNIDFRTFPAALCTAVRLTIKKMPERSRIGVTDFAVFGAKETLS